MEEENRKMVNVQKMEVEFPSSEPEEIPKGLEDLFLGAASESDGGPRGATPMEAGVQKCTSAETESRPSVDRGKERALERRKQKKKEKRREARKAERQERRKQRGIAAATSALPSQVGALKLGKTGESDRKPTSPGESTQPGDANTGTPRPSERGPNARDARRAAKKRTFRLPTEPASLREEAGKSTTTRGVLPTPGPSKRPRSDERTLPEREKKRIALDKREEGPANRSRRAGGQPNPIGRADPRPACPKAEPPTKQPQQLRAQSKSLQVVIRSNRPDGKVGEDEATELRRQLVAELKKALTTNRELELSFQKSGIVESGWFLITAKDETSADWLLRGWTPQAVGGNTFTQVRATEAPWPVVISFWISSPKPVDVSEVVEMLSLQNRRLDVRNWQHLDTREGLGGWQLIFRISQEDARSIESSGWELNYELTTLTVRRVTLWGPAAVGNAPGTSKQA